VADSVSFDFSALDALSAGLGDIPQATGKAVRTAIERTARSVKDEWNKNLYKDGHAKFTGRAITYDIEGSAAATGSNLTAEIGAVKGSGRQAGVVVLLEFGSINNPPHGAGHGALQTNQADFVKGMEAAAVDSLKEAGL